MQAQPVSAVLFDNPERAGNLAEILEASGITAIVAESTDELYTIVNCQPVEIVVLENGRVVEEGSHQELLSNNGQYARLAIHSS